MRGSHCLRPREGVQEESPTQLRPRPHRKGSQCGTSTMEFAGDPTSRCKVLRPQRVSLQGLLMKLPGEGAEPRGALHLGLDPARAPL